MAATNNIRLLRQPDDAKLLLRYCHHGDNEDQPNTI